MVPSPHTYALPGCLACGKLSTTTSASTLLLFLLLLPSSVFSFDGCCPFGSIRALAAAENQEGLVLGIGCERTWWEEPLLDRNPTRPRGWAQAMPSFYNPVGRCNRSNKKGQTTWKRRQQRHQRDAPRTGYRAMSTLKIQWDCKALVKIGSTDEVEDQASAMDHSQN
mmetsp:Transcript_2344/g.15671  ORF Transcript_2344/g.15671 Transcript_2344/m.15671 type:complete len:167 (+) Transcript_2344:2049-2549(+)